MTDKEKLIEMFKPYAASYHEWHGDGDPEQLEANATDCAVIAVEMIIAALESEDVSLGNLNHYRQLLKELKGE